MHGLSIPEDISIAGFDDLFIATYTDPPLTTVRQPMRRMGQLAMENLIKLMSGQEICRQNQSEGRVDCQGIDGQGEKHSTRKHEALTPQVARVPYSLSGLGSMISLTIPFISAQAEINCRKVLRVDPNVSNSSCERPFSV